MPSAAELKSTFQDGWNIPERVENYVRSVARGEFDDADLLGAWRQCLETALAAQGRLRILDVGTGPGVFACLYSQMGHECMGLDFSERMLGEALRRAAELAADCSFTFGDAEEPPFEPGTFDVVSSRHLLFNLPQPGLAVRRWARLLKPGGKMILIGDEMKEMPGPSLLVRMRRSLGRCLGRAARDRRPGWTPTADYLKAVSQCPLFRHNAGVIRAVMEAAGLERVRSYSTEAIFAARNKTGPAAGAGQQGKFGRMARGQPYLLVGSKMSDD